MQPIRSLMKRIYGAESKNQLFEIVDFFIQYETNSCENASE